MKQLRNLVFSLLMMIGMSFSVFALDSFNDVRTVEPPLSYSYNAAYTQMSVQTPRYRVLVNTDETSPDQIIKVLSADGSQSLFNWSGVQVVEGGKTYSPAMGDYTPKLYDLGSGRYLSQFSIYNVGLKAGDGTTWPGVAELILYCYEDRIFVACSFISATSNQVSRQFAPSSNPYTYAISDAFTNSPSLSPTSVALDFEMNSTPPNQAKSTSPVLVASDAVGFLPNASVSSSGVESSASLKRVSVSALATDIAPTPWLAGSIHEIGVLIAIGAGYDNSSIFNQHLNPLTGIAVTSGSNQGYDGRSGIQYFGQTGNKTVARLTNNSYPRRIMVDMGNKRGSMLDVSTGALAPTPQGLFTFHGRNRFLVPYDLGAGEMQDINFTGYGLYDGSMSFRPIKYWNSSSDNHPLIMIHQDQEETSTLRMVGPYVNTDFRPLNSYQGVDRTDDHQSAVSTGLMKYKTSDGVNHEFIVTAVKSADVGPYMGETLLDVTSDDGKMKGTFNHIGVSFSDAVRHFITVDVTVNQTINLGTHTFGESLRMIDWVRGFGSGQYTQIAYADNTGAVKVIDTKHNNTRLLTRVTAPTPAVHFFDGYFSREAGNPGFILLEWDCKLGTTPISPSLGVYGYLQNNNPELQGSTGVAAHLVPSTAITTIPAGSTFKFTFMMFTDGHTNSTEAVFQKELDAWKNGIQATMTKGTMVDSFPPTFEPDEDGTVEAVLTGGINRIPIRVKGYGSTPVTILYTDVDGVERNMATFNSAQKMQGYQNWWPAEGGRGIATAIPLIGTQDMIGQMPATPAGPLHIEITAAPVPRLLPVIYGGTNFSANITDEGNADWMLFNYTGDMFSKGNTKRGGLGVESFTQTKVLGAVANGTIGHTLTYSDGNAPASGVTSGIQFNTGSDFPESPVTNTFTLSALAANKEHAFRVYFSAMRLTARFDVWLNGVLQPNSVTFSRGNSDGNSDDGTIAARNAMYKLYWLPKNIEDTVKVDLVWIDGVGVGFDRGGLAGATLHVDGLEGRYEAWLQEYGLSGSQTNRLADLEPDGLDNYTEYIFGGNPLVDDASTVIPIHEIVNIGGQDKFKYVYNRRTDDLSLFYDLQISTNLVSGTWVSVGEMYESGMSSVSNHIRSVTNLIPMIEATKFIKLDVVED